MSGKPLSRRTLLCAAGAALGSAVLAGCSGPDGWDDFFQKRFQEMTPEEKAQTLARLEKKYRRQFGRDVRVGATPARAGTLFGFGFDLSMCIGCRRCVTACVQENNVSRDIALHLLRVLRMPQGETELAKGEHYYSPPEVPEEGVYYLPVPCMQCDNPPCVKVCPVNALWREPDGLVVVDYDWCIGCRDCMAACPYRAMQCNWTAPEIPPGGLNPETEYLGNRPRVRGVVEKCHGCLHRVRAGHFPACHEACPTGAVKFGNLLDEDSVIRRALREFRTFRLKAELNTEPKCFYFFSGG